VCAARDAARWVRRRRSRPTPDRDNLLPAGVPQTLSLIAVAERGPSSAQVFVYNLRNLYKKKVLALPEMVSKEIVSIAFSADDTVMLLQGGAPDWLLSCWLWEKGKVRPD
jgi:hypothetical protein